MERADQGPFPITEGALLNAGRACLRLIIDRLRPRRMHVPFLICDSVLLPLREAGVEVVFHGMDDAMRALFPREMAPDELLLVVDHHGVRADTVADAVRRHGPRAVIDLTHALYAPVQKGQWAFASVRKWFGVPDGGLLHAPVGVDLPEERNTVYSLDHLVLRDRAPGAEALAAYAMNNGLMRTVPLRASMVTEALLLHTDREAARKARVANFNALHALLGGDNRLPVDPDGVTGAIGYPFLPPAPVPHRALHARGLFVPCYWPDVLQRADPEGRFATDRRLAQEVLPLPIDQRYTPDDMEEVARRVKALC